MIEKESLGNGHVRVTFRVSQEIWADSIALVGEFNDWDPHSLPLHQCRGDEGWSVTIELEAGRTYRFRYVVDGEEWMDDDHCDGYELNVYATSDSVVRT
jgi:1,4-alpha-glucan branching enzyme